MATALTTAATCGAKTRAGSPCPNPAMENGRCRMHGGKSLSGIASPTFVHGRSVRSHTLPARLVERYEASVNDPDLLSLRHSIALADARTQDLLDRVDSGESGETWNALKKTWEECEENRHKADSGDVEARRDFWQAYEMIGVLISEGQSDYAAWRETLAVDEHRRRLADSERARVKDLKAMITAEKAMNLIGAVIGVVKTHVRDRTTLQRIAQDISRLVNGDVSNGSESGVE